jgi:hypothetical protein
MQRDAVIDGTYRYLLTRVWGPGPRVLFVMLNPSTADGLTDDNTIRRCIQFARDWGYDGIEVVNLFALRSKNPKALLLAADPVGPKNDPFIQEAAGRCPLVVCAWSSHKAVKRRRGQVVDLLRAAGVKPMCLKLAKKGKGEPWHPLYLKADLRPFPLP